VSACRCYSEEHTVGEAVAARAARAARYVHLLQAEWMRGWAAWTGLASDACQLVVVRVRAVARRGLEELELLSWARALCEPWRWFRY
jgi:hypothetical protein